MKNIPIIGKFLVIMASFGLFAIGVAVFSGHQLQKIAREYNGLVESEAAAALMLARSNRALQNARAAIGELLMARTNAMNVSAVKELGAARASFVKYMDAAVVDFPPAAAETARLKAEGLKIIDDVCANTIRKGSTALAEDSVKASQDTFLAECQPEFSPMSTALRGLAQRSTEAAKEIKDLISTSSAQVGQGVELVTSSGRSLDEIVTHVSDMSSVVSLIATSAREQAISLKDVSAAADQMDKVTQQNAAMVEQSTAAAHNLMSQTEELSSMVERFRISANDTSKLRTVSRTPDMGASRHKPVTQMRTMGSGGAAPLATTGQTADWAEF